jgi:hypothetical protein
MTAPVAATAEPTHDAVTAAMLRRRRLLGTLVLVGLAVVCLYLVVALLRARTQPSLGLQTVRSGVSVFTRVAPGGPVAIRMVRHGGPAWTAGLRTGDRVTRIDGLAADNVAALAARHDRLKPGDVVTYEIERNGQRLSRQVTVGALLHRRLQWLGVATRVVLVFALFLGIPALVYKWRPHDPRALLFMLFSNTFGLSMLNFAVPGAGQPPESIIPMPDAYIRVNAAGVLITYVCALVVSPSLFHFLTLFPQPRLQPEALARLLRWTYLVPATVAWVASPVALLLLSRQVAAPARFWVNVAFAGVATAAAALLWWTRLRGHAWRARLRDAPAVPVAVLALSYTALVLAVFVVVNLRSRPMAGLLGGLLMVAAIALFSLCIGLAYPIASAIAMWRSWRLSSDEERRQIRWPLLSITWALGIAVVLSVLSFTLSVTSSNAPPAWLYPVFEASTWVAYSVIPLAFAAAVLRYGLMDIRFIIRLTFFYLLTTASVYIGSFALVLLLATTIGEAAETSRVATILITLVAVSLIEPLRRLVQRRVDKHFYQRTPDPVGVIARHGQALRTVSRRDDLDRRLVLALQEAIPHAPTYVFRRREDHAEFMAAHSPDPTVRPAFAALPFLSSRAGELHGPTPLAELLLDEDEASTWDGLGIELLLPVRHGDALPVVMGLGRKRSDDAWHDRDVELLASLAAQTSMALADIEARQHDASLREAFDNQRALLPQQLPQPEMFSIAGAWHPALTVGGDYYDRCRRCLRGRRRRQGARGLAGDGQPPGDGQGAGRPRRQPRRAVHARQPDARLEPAQGPVRDVLLRRASLVDRRVPLRQRRPQSAAAGRRRRHRGTGPRRSGPGPAAHAPVSRSQRAPRRRRAPVALHRWCDGRPQPRRRGLRSRPAGRPGRARSSERRRPARRCAVVDCGVDAGPVR